MQHIHLTETESTQTLLRETLSQNPKGSDFLISTDKQTSGHGRQGSSWQHFKRGLAFSFTLVPHELLTLTPLEVGVHLCRFFKPKVLLKWPNDLLNEKKEKVGGILCQLIGDQVVVGVGINLFNEQNPIEADYPIGSLLGDESTNDSLHSDYKKALPLEIVKTIKAERLETEQIKTQFLSSCAHFEHEVHIINGNSKVVGKFIGLGDNGEALIINEKGETLKQLTGSLRF